MLPIGKAISLLRNAVGASLSDVSRLSGISLSYLSLIEKGSRKPSLDVAKRIANALNVPEKAITSLHPLVRANHHAANKPLTENGIAAALDKFAAFEKRFSDIVRNGNDQ